MIVHSIAALQAAGIRKVAIVVGYLGDRIRELLGNRQGEIEIDYIDNPVYEDTNNIFSLYLARDHFVKDDTLLLESDLIFESQLLRRIVDDPRPNLAVVDRYDSSWMDGTVVTVDEQNSCVNEFIPKQQIDEESGRDYFKTVNIYKLSQEFSCTLYMPFLKAYMTAVGANNYYEEVFRLLMTINKKCLNAFKMDGLKWYEIDNPTDKERAEKLFQTESPAETTTLHDPHGGFWRYPDLKDFRLLVNPHFPTSAMLADLGQAFPELLTKYPSGQKVQQKSVARMFGLQPEHVAVGNGASELIRGLAEVLTGNIGIVFPTFNEYAESFGDRVIPMMARADNDFRYTREDLVRHAARCDNLLLVNPDNPTGHFLNREEVLHLSTELKGAGCRLIIDESFIDFASADCDESLLQADLLEKFPGMMIVKSLGKSYGVPGARLGFVATHDREMAASLRAYLPIWNICSIGEYFLEIAPNFQTEFNESCRLVIQERDWLTQGLDEISFLRPLPSKANFVCCEVDSRFTAEQLSTLLLTSHRILIKDLATKPGIDGRQFVRIAVRNRVDNTELVAALRSLDRQAARSGATTPHSRKNIPTVKE